MQPLPVNITVHADAGNSPPCAERGRSQGGGSHHWGWSQEPGESGDPGAGRTDGGRPWAANGPHLRAGRPTGCPSAGSTCPQLPPCGCRGHSRVLTAPHSAKRGAHGLLGSWSGLELSSTAGRRDRSSELCPARPGGSVISGSTEVCSLWFMAPEGLVFHFPNIYKHISAKQQSLGFQRRKPTTLRSCQPVFASVLLRRDSGDNKGIQPPRRGRMGQETFQQISARPEVLRSLALRGVGARLPPCGVQRNWGCRQPATSFTRRGTSQGSASRRSPPQPSAQHRQPPTPTGVHDDVDLAHKFRGMPPQAGEDPRWPERPPLGGRAPGHGTHR